MLTREPGAHSRRYFTNSVHLPPAIVYLHWPLEQLATAAAAAAAATSTRPSSGQRGAGTQHAPAKSSALSTGRDCHFPSLMTSCFSVAAVVKSRAGVDNFRGGVPPRCRETQTVPPSSLDGRPPRATLLRKSRCHSVGVVQGKRLPPTCGGVLHVERVSSAGKRAQSAGVVSEAIKMLYLPRHVVGHTRRPIHGHRAASSDLISPDHSGESETPGAGVFADSRGSCTLQPSDICPHGPGYGVHSHVCLLTGSCSPVVRPPAVPSHRQQPATSLFGPAAVLIPVDSRSDSYQIPQPNEPAQLLQRSPSGAVGPTPAPAPLPPPASAGPSESRPSRPAQKRRARIGRASAAACGGRYWIRRADGGRDARPRRAPSRLEIHLDGAGAGGGGGRASFTRVRHDSRAGSNELARGSGGKG